MICDFVMVFDGANIGIHAQVIRARNIRFAQRVVRCERLTNVKKIKILNSFAVLAISNSGARTHHDLLTLTYENSTHFWWIGYDRYGAY